MMQLASVVEQNRPEEVMQRHDHPPLMEVDEGDDVAFLSGTSSSLRTIHSLPSITERSSPVLTSWSRSFFITVERIQADMATNGSGA